MLVDQAGRQGSRRQVGGHFTIHIILISLLLSPPHSKWQAHPSLFLFLRIFTYLAGQSSRTQNGRELSTLIRLAECPSTWSFLLSLHVDICYRRG